MKSELRFQVVRNGTARWLIWKLGEAVPADGGHSREFEEYARVVFDQGAWWVELPRWGSDGVSGWDRLPRPWALKDGAVASVTKAKEKKGAAA